jgi:hypothetical protein
MTTETLSRHLAPSVAAAHLRPYLRGSMIRFLSSLLVAIALLLSPLAMVNGAAMAMPHMAATGTVEMSADGHCAGEEAPVDEEKAPAKASCASACAAVPAASPVFLEDVAVTREAIGLRGPQVLSGICPEGETPPPRIVREI